MKHMPDKEDIFSTSESEARLDLIKHLIENSELVPLVRGMSGIGKSLLASRLQSGAPDNWIVCLFEADSMMQPERLLAHIARCNGLPDAKEDNIRRLVERFELMRKRGNVPVLLIDEAQLLPPTSLITLLRLFERQVGGGPLLSLVLFADEQIDMLLSTPQLQIMSPQSIQVIDLPPLTREEADSYMGYILKQEGLDQSLLLDAGRMNRIYRETGGAPGPLGSAIRKEVGELGEGPAGNVLRIGGPLLWAGISVVGLLLLLVLFQGPINRLFSPETEPLDGQVIAEARQAGSAEPEMVAGADSEPPAIVLPQPGQAEQAPLPQAISGSGPEAPVEQDARVAIESEFEPVPAGSPVVTPQKPPERIPESPSPELAQAQPTETPVVEPAAESSGLTTSPSEPETTQVAPVVPDPASDGQATEPETTQVEVTETAPPQAVESTAPGGAEMSGLLRSSDWLEGQPEGGYTLQLLAVGNVESVQLAVAKYRLQGQAFSIQGERRGRPWYPLLLGVYPNREAALAALKGLPAELQKSGAWARSLASLRP
jgi:DamX protein